MMRFSSYALGALEGLLRWKCVTARRVMNPSLKTIGGGFIVRGAVCLADALRALGGLRVSVGEQE